MKLWGNQIHYTIVITILCNNYSTSWTMELSPSNQTLSPSASIAKTPLMGKIYYELNTLLQEINYLKECMERIHNQHDLGEPFYNHKEVTKNNALLSTFHLNVKKKVGSLTLNLVESHVTLHAFSCKDTTEYSFIKQKLDGLYTACKIVVQRQIESIKAKTKDLSFMEHFGEFYMPYKELLERINQQCTYWSHTSSLYQTIYEICTHFEDEQVRKNCHTNPFGHEVFTALSDSLVIQFQKDLAKALILDDNMPHNSKETLVKRFASLYNTSNGKLLDPQKPATLIEQILARKALKTNYDPKTRLLILENCTLEWIKDHKTSVKKSLQDISSKVSSDHINHLIEPGGKPPKEVTLSQARIHNLYVILSQN